MPRQLRLTYVIHQAKPDDLAHVLWVKNVDRYVLSVPPPPLALEQFRITPISCINSIGMGKESYLFEFEEK